MSGAKRWIVVAVLLVGAAVAWGLWRRQASQVEPEGAPRARLSGGEARQELEQRLSEGPASGSRIVLSEGDLRRLLIATMSEHPDGARLLESAKTVVADVADGRVHLGVELDLDKLGELELNPEQRRVAEGIETLLRVLGQQTVYLGVEGTPEARAGKIVLGSGTRVKIGALDLSLDSFSERFGLDQEKLSDGVAFELPYFEVTEVEILTDALRLEVTAG